MNQFKVIFTLAMLAAGAGIGCIFGEMLGVEGRHFAAIVAGFTMFSGSAGVVRYEVFSNSFRWFKR